MNFKVGYKLTIELEESYKACHVTNQLGNRPMLQELVSRHGRTVAIRGHVDADKLQTLWEEMAFLETQGKTVRFADAKLTHNVFQGLWK